MVVDLQLPSSRLNLCRSIAPVPSFGIPQRREAKMVPRTVLATNSFSYDTVDWKTERY